MQYFLRQRFDEMLLKGLMAQFPLSLLFRYFEGMHTMLGYDYEEKGKKYYPKTSVHKETESSFHYIHITT